ncbi:MAG: AraC family transcriptional regulator [Flavobacteriales bacterium]|nr:AraC family transcriptional regulator [Flavobacteriales bacterium]
MLAILFIFSIYENKKANLFLGLSLLSLSIEVLEVLSSAISEDLGFFPTTSLFTIPLLLFYVHQTINNQIKSWFYLLFLPGLISNILFYCRLDNDLIFFFEYAFNLGILIYMLVIIGSHNERLNHFYSDLEHKKLRWIKIIVFIYIGFHALWIIEDIVGYQDETLIEYFAKSSSILTFFMIFWIGHNGFSQHETFSQELFTFDLSDIDTSIETVGQDKEKETKDRDHFEFIQRSIINERLFTNPKLDLRTLSKRVELSEKEVSRIINQQSDSNFYKFINKFRINEFKLLLDSEKAQQFSIFGLAQEAGFNSKSTFYKVFKEIEGTTPNELKA